MPGPARSPAAAFAWEFRRRHRWGLAAVGLYFAALAGLRLMVLGPGRIAFVESWQFGLMVVVPLAATFTYFLAVFTFGLDGDLGARRSLYPARKLTLPVSNTALAGWPLVYGGAAMAVLWWLTRLLALWPPDVAVPWLWPALFAAVFLAWSQALTWMPYPLPGLRVGLAVLWLTIVGAGCLLALHLQVSENRMVALLAPQLPLAFLLTRYAVARARRGDGFSGRGPSARDARRRRRPPFASPAQAQAWFERRWRGRSLPGSLPWTVALVLPFELSLLFAFRDTPSLLQVTLLAVLLTPPVVAAFVGPSRELPPFLAVRPLSSTALLRAKLGAIVHSTWITWLLVLVAVPLALGLSGTEGVVTEGARRLVERVGTPRAGILALLLFAALVVTTGRQLVQGLLLGLSGRPWVGRVRVFGTLVVLSVVVSLLPWLLQRPDLLSPLWNALPWVLAVLAVFKLVAAGWIVVRVEERGLLRDRTLLLGALGWSLTVLALHGLLLWLLPAALFPPPLPALVAILAVPLVRPAATLPALIRNRHR